MLFNKTFLLVFIFIRDLEASRKVSGTAINIKDAPYMAHVTYKAFRNETFGEDYNCGGTIISRQYILTAGHCKQSIKVNFKILRILCFKSYPLFRWW
jgi:secreted trypsin-like serine protease